MTAIYLIQFRRLKGCNQKAIEGNVQILELINRLCLILMDECNLLDMDFGLEGEKFPEYSIIVVIEISSCPGKNR
jgi:hypothetical protein